MARQPKSYQSKKYIIVKWLKEKMAENEWTGADLAREANKKGVEISEPVIWRVLNKKVGAGVEFCNRIAIVFDASPVTVFQMAGLLPPGIPDDISWEDYKVILAQLPEDDQEELLRIAKMKLEQFRKGGKNKKDVNPKQLTIFD